MTLPKKPYEALKFFAKFIPLLVTVLGGVLVTCEAPDKTAAIIMVIIGGLGTLAQGTVEICKSNHWKLIAKDGTIEELSPDTEEERITWET